MPDNVYTASENDVDRPLEDGLGEVSAPEQAALGAPGAVEFFSRSANLRLVYSPAREARNNWGDIVEKREEQAVEFFNNRYLCDPQATFDDGKSVLEWLRGHRNKDIEQAGFVEVEPLAPPPSTDDLDAITLAVVNRDEETLAKMAAAEMRGHAREEVLSPIRTALDALERARLAEGSSGEQKGP